jgi:phosphotransferase system enzyme I (PtsI)
MIIEAGRETGTPVSMCGEMAGDPHYVPMLLGMGLRELSMQPNSLLEIKEIVRNCRAKRLTKLVKRLFKRLETEDISVLLDEINHFD